MRPEAVRLRGNLRDRRFNPVLQQSLGRVAETLAGRLLTSEGFQVKKFSRYASPYVAGIRYATNMDPRRKQDLWDELLEEHGSLFGEPRVREFLDELVQYRISRKQSLNLGASIDLIARKDNDLHLIEVKSAGARVEKHQIVALEIARKHSIQTGIVRVQLNVSFDRAELYHVMTNQDVRIVSNMPDETLA